MAWNCWFTEKTVLFSENVNIFKTWSISRWNFQNNEERTFQPSLCVLGQSVAIPQTVPSWTDVRISIMSTQTINKTSIGYLDGINATSHRYFYYYMLERCLKIKVALIVENHCFCVRPGNLLQGNGHKVKIVFRCYQKALFWCLVKRSSNLRWCCCRRLNR